MYILRTGKQVALSLEYHNKEVIFPIFCPIESIPWDRFVMLHDKTFWLEVYKRWTETAIEKQMFETWDKTPLYIEKVKFGQYDWLDKEYNKIEEKNAELNNLYFDRQKR